MRPYYERDGITIYCGDCRDVLPLLPPADLVLTDPPYTERTHRSIRSNSAKATAGNRSITFASMTTDDLRESFVLMGRTSARWVVSTLDHATAFAFEQDPPDGLRMLRIGVWVKTNPMPSIIGDRPGQGWEAIAYMHRADAKPAWNGGVRHGNFVLPTAQDTGHPTAKPLAMYRQFLAWFTRPGDLVLDPFMGSGTMLRAALDCGRRAIGIEIEERYCEIAVRRLQQAVLPLEVA